MEKYKVMRERKTKRAGWMATISRKWKQASFTLGVLAGVVVNRCSAYAPVRRVLSALGIVLEQRRIRGTVVEIAEIDERRRAFLKYAAFGGAVLFAGRYISPIVNALRGDTVLSEKTFENFKITETGRQLRVTDDDGGEVLTIDKESF